MFLVEYCGFEAGYDSQIYERYLCPFAIRRSHSDVQPRTSLFNISFEKRRNIVVRTAILKMPAKLITL